MYFFNKYGYTFTLNFIIKYFVYCVYTIKIDLALEK